MSFTGEIINCYDSHCHFIGAGQVSLTLNLRDLGSISELKTIVLKSEYFFGEWLIGFGWDQSKFSNQALPNRFDLDLVFSKFPVALSRADGHAILLNSFALQLIGQPPEALLNQIEFKDGQMTGLFFEQAKEWVEKFIPQPSAKIQKAFLLEACRVYNKAGITHIRDMTTSELQWDLELELLSEGSLSLCIEHLFLCESPQQIESTVAIAKKCKNLENEQMLVEGIKIFIDGSLGSKTAYLTRPYLDSPSQGLLLWTFEDIKKAIHAAWSFDLGIAIHAIGDAASELALTAAYEVKIQSGLNGWISIEHAEILSDKSIELSKFLNVRFHFQPCHFLTDIQWLKHHIDSSLMDRLFRWKDVENISKQIFFGTDCPVEIADPMRNFFAIEEAAKIGINRPSKATTFYHQCQSFRPTKKSIFENSKFIRTIDL